MLVRTDVLAKLRQSVWLTFAVWLKLGEFLLRSIGPISDRGRCAGVLPFILFGDDESVFF